MVAIPYFDNARIESFLVTYVLMKDNWHSSENRYMLDNDDLDMAKDDLITWLNSVHTSDLQPFKRCVNTFFNWKNF